MAELSPSELLKDAGLSHLLTHKSDGNMSYRWGEKQEVIANRKKVLAKLGLGLDDCYCPRMDGHTDGVEVITASKKGVGMFDRNLNEPADAIITNTKGIGLWLFIADCIPVVIYDPINIALGLSHLSWQTSSKHLAAKTVSEMNKNFDSDPSQLKIFMGPSIKQESYKFEDPEQKTMPDWQPYLRETSDGLTSIDLVKFNFDEFVSVGVLSGSIEVSPINTAMDPRFFSHYRDSRAGDSEGRFAVVAVL